ncbi:uncharacterized protein LOC135840542 [Planococcus citri]|uniref:uncharacterized protein LOC135840542 n=1 Tax=Planococcus citri TaxID=170843 RepID=UPI0031F94449
MYKICFLIAIIVQNFACIFGRTEEVCSLRVDTDFIKVKQPLMVVSDGKDYSLVSPEKNKGESVINLTGDDKVILVCPGKGNQLLRMNKDIAVTTCKRNKLQTDDGRQIIKGTDQFSCKDEITPLIENTGRSCGENSQSTIFNIEYLAESLDKTFKMLTICHDVVNMNTIYSTNTIKGKSVDARQKNVPRPAGFMEGNLKILYNGGSPNEFYLKKNQIERFKKIFQTENVSSYVDLYYKYLSRGHLTPDADEALSSWKVATYMYINVAPQWQSINAGNWLKVENKVREAASLSQDEFTIITGTYGVMKLRIGQIEHEIYLHPDNKLRVPEQFWKVVYHEKTQTAIVVITSNNPFTRIKLLCPDVCKDYNWSQDTFQSNKYFSRGYTYCCTYKSFQDAVPYVPSLTVQGTYTLPKKPPLSRFRSAIKTVVRDNVQEKWNQWNQWNQARKNKKTQ